MLRRVRAALAIAAASACGPTVGQGGSGQPDTTGSTTATTAESTGTGFDPLPPSCGPTPQAGVDPLAGEPTCDQLTGLQEGVTLPEVRVRIVNRTDETIAVSNRTSGCTPPPRHFDVEGTATWDGTCQTIELAFDD